MQHYAGIDVSLELLSVCIVDAKGKIVKEAKVGSDPDTLVAFLRGLDLAIERIGLEAGPLSQWLHAGLTSAGFEAVLLETRHVKAALSAMTVKTDRKDARGIAQLIRMGWFRAVHCKSAGSQEVRALLVARKLLLSKLLDVEFSIRGILRGFGLKMGMVTRKRFEVRVRELYAGHAMLEQICSAMLTARSALQTEYAKLHKALLVIVREDEVCRRLMTTPGVGPLVAITFKTGVDDPSRIHKSKAVGALFGLTPKKYQSGKLTWQNRTWRWSRQPLYWDSRGFPPATQTGTQYRSAGPRVGAGAQPMSAMRCCAGVGIRRSKALRSEDTVEPTGEPRRRVSRNLYVRGCGLPRLNLVRSLVDTRGAPLSRRPQRR